VIRVTSRGLGTEVGDHQEGAVEANAEGVRDQVVGLVRGVRRWLAVPAGKAELQSGGWQGDDGENSHSNDQARDLEADHEPGPGGAGGLFRVGRSPAGDLLWAIGVRQRRDEARHLHSGEAEQGGDQGEGDEGRDQDGAGRAQAHDGEERDADHGQAAQGEHHGRRGEDDRAA
jgi:hypothetical protein